MGFYEKFNHCCFIFYLNLRLAFSNLEFQIPKDIDCLPLGMGKNHDHATFEPILHSIQM